MDTEVQHSLRNVAIIECMPSNTDSFSWNRRKLNQEKLSADSQIWSSC